MNASELCECVAVVGLVGPWHRYEPARLIGRRLRAVPPSDGTRPAIPWVYPEGKVLGPCGLLWVTDAAADVTKRRMFQHLCY
jgi:hypothetical protein